MSYYSIRKKVYKNNFIIDIIYHWMTAPGGGGIKEKDRRSKTPVLSVHR